MRILVLFFILLSASQVATADDELVVLVVDGVGSPMWNVRHLELFDHYKLTNELKSDGRLRLWSEDPFAAYRDVQGQKGYVLTLGTTGRWVRASFVTLKNPGAFSHFISGRLDKAKKTMGPELEAKVKRAGDRITIELPAHVWKNNPRFRSPAWEEHYRYSEPVMINLAGSPSSSAGPYGDEVAVGDRQESGLLQSLQRVPIKKIAPLLKSARGKLSYYVFQPGELPDSLKLAALRKIARQVAPRLQRRNIEDLAAYEDRKSVADSKLSLIGSSLLDIEEARAWTEWPEGDKPYRTQCRVQAKKGSKLHGLFTALKSASSKRVALGSGNVGSIRLAAGIPETIRPILNAWLRDLTGSEVGAEFLGSQSIRFSGRLDINGDDLQFVAVGQGDFADGAIKFLTPPTEAPLEIGPIKLESVNYSAAAVEGGIGLGISTRLGVALPGKVDLERVSSAPLAVVECDLAPVLKARNGEQVSKLLRSIERAYTRSLVGTPSAVEMAQGILERPDADSLLERATPEGDWKITARLDIRRNVAVLDVTVGADAHRFWRLQRALLNH
jgi:hypothetical protein